MYNTKKLKQIRIEKGYNIYDMAKLTGISYSHYSLLENMKRKLTYEMAIKIAAVFDKKPDELFLDN